MIRSARESWLTAGFAALAAVALSFASFWILTEQDVYWQIRAGDELLKTWKFPDGDEWSFTGRGGPWLNVQWISTILIRAAYFAAQSNGTMGEYGLIVARMAGVCVLLLVLAWMLARAAAPTPEVDRPIWGRSAILSLLLPWFFLEAAFRLQIRADLFVFAVFAFQIGVWLGTPERGWGFRRKAWASLACIALAANLHHGTAPFLLASAWVFALSEKNGKWDREIIGFLAASVPAFFATPYGVRVIPFLVEHFFYYQFNVMPNPDHQPLAWRHFMPSEFSWAAIAWAAMTLAAAASWYASHVRGLFRLPGPFAHRWYPALAGLGLTWMCTNRLRAFPYQAIFILPYLSAGLWAWMGPRGIKVMRGAWSNLNGSSATAPWWNPSAVVAVLGLAVWVLVFPDHLRRYRIRMGFDISEVFFPVGSTRFLARARPESQIFTTFTYGHYLTWNLREYPVFVDTRETMYRHLQQRILDAYTDADAAHAIYRDYAINAVLVPIPKTRYIPEVGGWEDVIERFCPRAEWAVVYFDRVSVVVIRRTPANERIIAENEFKVLRPNLPANLYVHSKTRTPENDERFRAEVARCLSNEPENATCLTAQGAELMRSKDRSVQIGGKAALEAAVRVEPANITALGELESAYRAFGDFARAEQVGSRLRALGFQ